MKKATRHTGSALICALLLSASAVRGHTTSWNRAIIDVREATVSLTLQMAQQDLLGAVSSGADSASTLSGSAWDTLMPQIRDYIFSNLMFTINGIPAGNGTDGRWFVRDEVTGGNTPADTIMRTIEVSRSWTVRDTVRIIGIRPDLLTHVTVPVRWVVMIDSARGLNQKSYAIIDRGQEARYDLDRKAWLETGGDKGVRLAGEERSVVGRLKQVITVGFNRINLTELFQAEERPFIIVLYLMIALMIGAFHSLSPGHGKAVIGAYIISSRGTVADAVTLGAVTAISHTASVLILGFILLIVFDSVVPDSVTAYLNLCSGIIILSLGCYLFVRRLRELRGTHAHTPHDHDHDTPLHSHTHTHGHCHGEEHFHDHDHGSVIHSHTREVEHGHDERQHGHAHVSMESVRRSGFWSNVMLGVSGGMVPCPTALVILFLAVSLKKLSLGLLLILFFSFGLAATLTGMGILFAKGSRLIERYDHSRIVPKLPVISAGVIAVLGAAIAIRAAFLIL
jgi:ABC-type nickel/cobalt efflux system permease component RcnA